MPQKNKQKIEKKPIFKKWWFWVLIGVVLLFVIILATPSNDTNTGAGDDKLQELNRSLEENKKKYNEESENNRKLQEEAEKGAQELDEAQQNYDEAKERRKAAEN